jgi:hypothetical protein
MSEGRERELPKQPEESRKAFVTQPLAGYEILSRVAHEPGSYPDQLSWIDKQMGKIKVGESFVWHVSDDIPLTITKVDDRHYTLKYPEGYVD